MTLDSEVLNFNPSPFIVSCKTVPARTGSHSLTKPAEPNTLQNARNAEASTIWLQLEILSIKTNHSTAVKPAKDICMWVSCVARLGYCSTQGLRTVTGWTLSSPNRPWSMASGGILSGNLPPRTGCPPRHQHPFFTHSGGL